MVFDRLEGDARSIELRAIDPTCAVVLGILHAAAWAGDPGGEVWDTGAFKKFLVQPGMLGLLAVDPCPPDGGPVGFVLACVAADEAEILNLAVLPAWRGQGVGGELVAAVIATTGKCGRELFTLADRPQHLYQVGSMGCASSMGLGALYHLAPDRM